MIHKTLHTPPYPSKQRYVASDITVSFSPGKREVCMDWLGCDLDEAGVWLTTEQTKGLRDFLNSLDLGDNE